MKVTLIAFSMISFFLCASYASITKREVVKDGVVYIEETQDDGKGMISTATYPKPGQEKHTTTSVKDSSGNVKTTTKTEGSGITSEISITQSKEEASEMSKAMAGFYDALGECKPFKSFIKHPLMPDFTIKMEVHGMSEAKCKYTQTMPNNGLQTCLLTELQRNEVRSSSGKALENFMQDQKTCKITGY